MEHVNVLIIGAGISGISAACHLRMNNPDTTFTILEGREALGGTWDLFRYPGIRSDSDMYTFGFSFKPWEDDQDIATGDAILSYLNETVDEYEDGEVVSHDGSWLVGGPTLPSDPVGTATATDPAIFMLANPEVGDTYKPEDTPPDADETVRVKKFVKKFKTEAGKFKDVMMTKEFEGPELEPEGKKWYARHVGEIYNGSEDEKLELIATTYRAPDEG